MKILASPTPRRHHAPEAPPERPRAVAPARLGCAPGTSADVLRDLRAFAAIEDSRRAIHADLGPDPVTTEPLPMTNWADKLRAVEADTLRQCTHVTAVLAGMSERYLAAGKKPIAALHRELLDDVEMVPTDATRVRMAFDAVADADEDAFVTAAAEWILAKPDSNAPVSTYDHRPLGKPVGRELPAEETAMPDHQWFNEPTPEQQAAAAQRDATRASWRGLGLADGTPPPIGMDPFHEPGNPACVCTQCTIAAAVAMKAGNARTETAG